MGDNLLILDFDDGLKIEEKFSSYKINSTNRSIKKNKAKISKLRTFMGF